MPDQTLRLPRLEPSCPCWDADRTRLYPMPPVCRLAPQRNPLSCVLCSRCSHATPTPTLFLAQCHKSPSRIGREALSTSSQACAALAQMDSTVLFTTTFPPRPTTATSITITTTAAHHTLLVLASKLLNSPSSCMAVDEPISSSPSSLARRYYAP